MIFRKAKKCATEMCTQVPMCLAPDPGPSHRAGLYSSSGWPGTQWLPADPQDPFVPRGHFQVSKTLKPAHPLLLPTEPQGNHLLPPLAFVLEISRSLPRQEPPPSNPVPLPATELTAGHTGPEGTCGAHPVSPPGNNWRSKSARVF